MFLAEDKKEGFGKTFFALLFASKTVSNEFYTKVRGILYEYTPMWMSGISNLSEQDQDVFWKLVKGKLIYTDPETKKETKLYIKDLQNPLEGKLPLSVCDNAEKFLSIHLGYRKSNKKINPNTVAIWIAPRFLIERDLEITASYFKTRMNNWKQEQAPVGIFWTWGGGTTVKLYDYLTTKSLNEISKNNLFSLWRNHSEPSYDGSGVYETVTTINYEQKIIDYVSRFVFELK